MSARENEMKDNKTLKRKADMALSDLTSGGQLVAQQARNFYLVAIKKAVALGLVRTMTMRNPSFEAPKMTTLGRVLQPGSSGVPLASAERSKPGFSKVTISSSLMKGSVKFPREVLEDNIEQNRFRSTLVGYVASHVSGDMEDILINGDTTSSDAFLALFDGMLAKHTSNVKDGGGANLSKNLLRDLAETLPEEFESDAHEFWSNRYAIRQYRSSLSDRATALGDTVITGQARADLGYDGIRLRRIPKFPNNLGAGSNETRVLFLNPRSQIVGLHRNVTFDSEFQIEPQEYVIVVTLRMGYQPEHEPASAIMTKVVGKA